MDWAALSKAACSLVGDDGGGDDDADAAMLSWLWRVMCGANCRGAIIGAGPLGCLKVAAASVAFVLITPGCIWWGASKLTPYVFLLVDSQ